MNKSLTLSFAVLLFVALSFPTLAAESIGVFDLRYTLKCDLDDPGELRTAWDDVHAVACLQGVVNRGRERLYVKFVERDGRCIDEYWWDKFAVEGEWLHGRETREYADIVSLFEAYKNEVNGVVLYDPGVAASSNLASAVAGVENLIAIRYDRAPGSLYSRLVLSGPKLPVIVRLLNEGGGSMFTGEGKIPGTERKSSGSIKCDAYIWFIEHYMKPGKCNTEFGAYYIDQKWLENPKATVRNHHTLSNHDFFISKKAFFFDLSPWGDEPATDEPTQPPGVDLATLKELLLLSYRGNDGDKFTHIGGFPAWAFKYTKHAGGKHEDVATEWEFSRIISAYNAFKDADAIGFGAMANASFWQHFPLKEKYPQDWVSRESLKERGYLTEDGKVDFKDRQFMIFYVGDYDAASWVYQTVPSLWDHPDRSKLPLMWCISPILSRRVPMAMHYIRESASKNDYFAAADNGAGYLMPGMLREPREISGLPDGLDAWAAHCRPLYEKWGLSITGFIIDGEAPGLGEKGFDCYAKFSPNGIVPQKCPLAALHKNMPILRADYDLVSHDPKVVASVVRDRIRDRPIRFHWFRDILKSPQWHLKVMEELERTAPEVELLDAQSFFELLRIHLENEQAENSKHL